MLSFINILAKSFRQKHIRRSLLLNFIERNTVLYDKIFGGLHLSKEINEISLEEFDSYFGVQLSWTKNMPLSRETSSDDSYHNQGITNFTVNDNQKLNHEKVMKYVRFDFAGGRGNKILLRTFLKQCNNAIKLCKQKDLNILYLSLIAGITGEAQTMLKDLNFDKWDEIVTALKSKYGEPETFSQRLYNFITSGTKNCRAASTCEKCKYKGHTAEECRTKKKIVRRTEAKVDKKLKLLKRACRLCEKNGHYDSDCTELKAFKDFKKNKLSKSDDEDAAEFSMIKTQRATLHSF